jgi:sterol desaturase/sphingolipid hydroxylase (fatty acid hydroxylase superfamily)
MADIDWSSFVDWEVITFFILVLAFDLWERLRPARDVNRFAELKLDLLSFALAVLMARMSRHAVDTLLGAVSPGFVLSSLETIRAWPGVVKIALALVVVDFIIYWIHRAQHRSEFMWRTHKWHHSIQEMYWFSGFRTSFAHSFLYNIPQTVIPMHLFHLSPWQAGVGYSIGTIHPILGAHECAGEHRMVAAHLHHAAIPPRAPCRDQVPEHEFRHDVFAVGPNVRHLCRSRGVAGKLRARARRKSAAAGDPADVFGDLNE